MDLLLARFLRRFRPREGWLPLLLTFIALLCAPAALVDVSSDLGVENLLILTILAATVGLRMARSRLSVKGSAILGGLLGVVLVTIMIGRLFPRPALLWREIGYTLAWLSQTGEDAIVRPLPFSSTVGYFGRQLTDLGIRLWWWGQTVMSDGVAQDSIIFLLLTALLAWANGLFAVWQIYRRRKPLVGLMPGGVSVAVVAFFQGGLATFYLLTFLFCTLCLLAICHLWVHRDRWEQTGTDYPGDMGVELAIALAPWLVVLLLLALIFPVVHPRQIRDAFWEVMDRPWSTVVQAAERLFGPIEAASSSSRGGAGALPQAHLLGAGPELDETLVFYVTTDDPPPPLPELLEMSPIDLGLPRRYWRGATYDVYTGQGWTNSILEPRTSPPEQPIDLYPGALLSSGPDISEQGSPPASELRQQFALPLPDNGLLHAANAPWLVDHPVQSWWRAPGDLAQLTSNTDRYTVISHPPEPTVADLRAADPILSPDLAERYLALPDSTPQRVLDLAADVAGEVETRYDRAHAIEFFLRTYTYTLDLPSPPTDRDLVDYFLFELQEGYCDYYASAMVVMARAIGVPARLATGYAQGTYDHEEARWVVTEKDGHSWVEVYFSDIGWVEFEPTAGQPALTRTGAGQAAPSVPLLPARSPSRSNVPWSLLGLGGALVLLVALVGLIWWPRRRSAESGSDLIRDRHARLSRWGARLGQPPHDGQTPFEYGHRLGEALHTRGQESRWPQVRRASVEAPGEVERLTGTFVRAQYGSEPISDSESWEIRELWTRLRLRLWWLWLGRR